MMEYSMLKAIGKGLITFLPGVAELLDNRKKKSRHSSSNAEFAYSLWLSVLVFLKENNIEANLNRIGEIGNGGSLGVAFCAILAGSQRYYDLEFYDNINVSEQLRLLEKIALLFQNKTPIRKYDSINIKIKNYDFPVDYVLPDREQTILIEQLRRDIVQGFTNSRLIRIIDNWESAPSLALDFVFSRAVMEHVKNPSEVYASIYNHLKNNSYMLHDIELHSHGVSKQIDGHLQIKPFWWRLIVGKRPFLMNRWSFGVHLDEVKKQGFLPVIMDRVMKLDNGSLREAEYGAVMLAKV